ncbi:MAG: OmpA family protein [Rhizobiaceae bacterium]
MQKSTTVPVAFVAIVASIATVTLAVSVAGTSSASAQEISSDDIIKKLAKKPKTRSLTRSLSKKKKMKAQDRDFLGSLGRTRGIKFLPKGGSESVSNSSQGQSKQPTYEYAEIEKIEKIVDTYELPKLEFQIAFEFGSAQVSGSSIIQVVELAKALNHPSLQTTRIILGGHTDAKGSDEFNQQLSQKRSNAVAKLIAEIGHIDASRLVPIGFGEHQLKNTYDPHAAENRRVEVINIGNN